MSDARCHATVVWMIFEMAGKEEVAVYCRKTPLAPGVGRDVRSRR